MLHAMRSNSLVCFFYRNIVKKCGLEENCSQMARANFAINVPAVFLCKKIKDKLSRY